LKTRKKSENPLFSLLKKTLKYTLKSLKNKIQFQKNKKKSHNSLLYLSKKEKKRNGTQRLAPTAATLHLLLLHHHHHHRHNHPITYQWSPATSSTHRLHHSYWAPHALPSFNGTLNHCYSDWRRRSTSGGSSSSSSSSEEKEREAKEIWDA
jgi:hypothetical protein